MVNQSNDFDVAVVGAGPAGIATSIAVAMRGLSAVLIERSRLDQWRPGEMLMPEFLPAVNQLGIGEQFHQQNFRRSPGIVSCWESALPLARDFVTSLFGSGFAIDRPAFDRWLLQCAAQAGVCISINTSVSALKRCSHAKWQIDVMTEACAHSVHASLVVDATGSTSRLATQHGVVRKRLDRLMAIVARLPHVRHTDSRLLLEACEIGWWYCLAQPKGGLVAALLTDMDLLQADPDPLEFWSHHLQSAPHVSATIASNTDGMDLKVRSAHTGRLLSFAGEGWLAVGEAAASLDPLSGNGIRRAIESGIRAADALQGMLGGNDEGLSRYLTWQESLFNRLVVEQRQYYRKVRRWPGATFWQRRHSSTLPT